MAYRQLQVEKLKRKAAGRPSKQAPEDWHNWLLDLFPAHVTHPFAQRHVALWDWAWAIEQDSRPQPFVAVWPRGGGKSVSAELATVALGARGKRHYAWYVSRTQDQADKHLDSISALLEDSVIDSCYPELGQRKLGKFGNPKGWRRNRLRTASGFTIDAMGLDSAVRGARVEQHRPDVMVFDDIDEVSDTPVATQKKIDVLTKSLLPAGSNDCAVLAIQNLMIPDGVFAQLADGRAEFLRDRIVSGPYPAIDNMAVEQRDGRFVITAGTATWEGQSLAVCQEQMDTWGYSAFDAESQSNVTVKPGGIFSHLVYRHCRWDEVPDLVRTVVWVDPAVTSTDQSDSHGIQADGIAANLDIYRLRSWEGITSPLESLQRAILWALELKADGVGVETDQGGDTWRPTYEQAWQKLVEDPDYPHVTRDTRQPAFKAEKAGTVTGSKVHRAQQMSADYEKGRFVHVLGTHETLERALYRFPLTKPFDLVDGAYWCWHDLRQGGRVLIAVL